MSNITSPILSSGIPGIETHFEFEQPGQIAFLNLDEFKNIPGPELNSQENLKEQNEFFKPAQACIAYVDRIAFISSNYIDRSHRLSEHLDALASKNKGAMNELQDCSPSTKKYELYNSWYQAINDELEKLRTAKRLFISGLPKQDQWIQATHKHALNKFFRLGNCSEISDAGFYYLLKYSTHKVETFKLKNGDHHFTVFRRKNGSDPKNHKEWGEDCLVIENWNDKKRCFYAHEIPQYLENYLDVGDDFLPITEAYDPRKHQLKRIVGSLLTSEDLGVLSKQDPEQEVLDWFTEKLKEFEKSESHEQKKKIAQEMIAYKMKCCRNKNQLLIQELKSQLRFFLDPQYLKVFNLNAKKTRPASAFEASDHPIDIDQSFLSRNLVIYLVKIADLFSKNDYETGTKKLDKLNDQILNSLSLLLWQNLDEEICSEYESYEFMILRTEIADESKTAAIYAFIEDKIKIALIAGREKTAFQILSLLPGEAQQQIRHNLSLG